MSLVLETLTVREVRLGERDRFEGGQLEVDADALARTVKSAIPVISGIRIDVARPGDSTRVFCCKDVIQPGVKLAGTGYGTGRRRLLENLAVVTCGPIVGFQEGIIDMSGTGASYTPFSRMLLLTLEAEVSKATPAHDHEAAIRQAGLMAAEYLARVPEGVAPERSETVSWDTRDVDPSLPRVAYICMVLSQGLLHDTWVMGRNAREGLPRVLDPRIFLDGGLTSGNCVSACDKNTTYHHCNNPVVRELLHEHGKSLNFVGVVVTHQPVRLAEKENAARSAAALVQDLSADGVIVTKEGFGNPDSDFMMILRLLSRSGMASVGVTDEFAGSDGRSQSIADSTPEADAIISTGNANEKVVLSPMRNIIGPAPDVERLAGGYAGCLRADGTLEVELQAIIGATNELGFGFLSACET